MAPSAECHDTQNESCDAPEDRGIAAFVFSAGSIYGTVTVAVFDGVLSAPPESTVVT